MAKEPEQKKRGRAAADPNETKAQKFVRLAKGRSAKVVAALEAASASAAKAALAIDKLGNLSGPSYDKTPEQIAAIKTWLDSTIAKYPFPDMKAKAASAIAKLEGKEPAVAEDTNLFPKL